MVDFIGIFHAENDAFNCFLLVSHNFDLCMNVLYNYM